MCHALFLPPILKYQHFASNGPYAPRACKPKSIATYYKTALQILHASQSLLLGMLPSCQAAEQRLGLSKEICKRMAALCTCTLKGRCRLWMADVGLGALVLLIQLGETKQDELPLISSTFPGQNPTSP